MSVRAAAIAVVVASLVACGLGPGERFGRAGATADRLRVQIADDARELDPVRAGTSVERALARQLFGALVESGARPSLASSWETRDGRRLLLHLVPDARFSDSTRLDAGAVVWSWQRALRPSSGTVDKQPLAVVAGGADLARGALLRIAGAGARGRPPPFSIFTEAAARPVNTDELPAGTAVRVVDTNEREPCCGVAVPLHVSADLASPAVGALLPGEIAVVAGAREVPAASASPPNGGRSGGGRTGSDGARGDGGRSGSRGTVTLLQLRAAGGAAGWASADDVAVHIPAVGLVHVVDRGAHADAAPGTTAPTGGAQAQPRSGAPTLREGPDDDAPVRAVLADDDLVELVERGPDHCLVIAVKSGRSGWLSSRNIDDTVRERRFFLVAPVVDAPVAAAPVAAAPVAAAPVVAAPVVADPVDGGAGVTSRPSSSTANAGASRTPSAATTTTALWLPEQDLAFDPGLLDAHAVDESTLDVGLAPDVTVEQALAAFVEPVLRPVPPRLVEERGRTWIEVGAIATSGPFVLTAHEPERIELARSATSFEAANAGVAHVDLVVVKRATTALHLYRAGELDVLLDGALPPDLSPTLARASDFVPGPGGGALVAPEVQGLLPTSLELRGVTVRAP